MPKNNDNNVRFNIQRQTRGVKAAFNKFKYAVDNVKIFKPENENLIKLTLDNLLNEIKTATKVIKAKCKK